MEGTTKTILVKEGLIGKTMDRYCLPKAIANQVIQDIHLSHMDLGINAIVQKAHKFIWIPGLYSPVHRELTKCIGYMQKTSCRETYESNIDSTRVRKEVLHR